ncbi:MAG: AglZ/HisF2 family acetamidino modification protein [Gemmatimonadales bacterium]
MLIPRVIPSLLLSGNRLVKSTRFERPVYVGDPVNAIRIFNEKEVDELVLLDIDATREGRGPNVRLLADIASECFMPLAYGGGLTTVEQMREVLSLGMEKVVLNTVAFTDPAVVRAAADRFGSSSVVVSVDARRRRWGGYRVMSHAGGRDTRIDPVQHAVRMQETGAGELLLNSIDRDGTLSGYDLDLIRQVAAAVDIPVVAGGGASGLHDFRSAVDAGASAVAAGALFVFQGPHRAVLITFPARAELEALLRPAPTPFSGAGAA